ncbi:MAG: hypothetical protein RIQ52_2051 [Pseudomonadota bacterium]|jgi:hypothetical protein
MNIIKVTVLCQRLLVLGGLCLSVAHAAGGGGHVDPALLNGHRYGPVRKEDTIWSIAWLMHRHHESIQKVVDELVMDNPDAFSARGRILKPGSYLERKPHQHTVVGALPPGVEGKSAVGPDVAGYLHESDPVVRSEMPDNGFSPDIIPFRQALQDQKPLQSGSAGVSVPTSSVTLVDRATIRDDTFANNREDAVAGIRDDTSTNDREDAAAGIREDTSTNDREDVVADIREDASAHRREDVITESDGGMWTSFISGMLGGCLVLALYILMTRKGGITYSISRHHPQSRGEAEAAGHHQEQMAAATEMSHTFARRRHPDDPLTEPSEQDLLNWSRSLSAIQDTTRAEEDLSNRLSTSR